MQCFQGKASGKNTRAEHTNPFHLTTKDQTKKEMLLREA